MDIKHEYYFEYWSEKVNKWMFEKGIITDEPAKDVFEKHLKSFNPRFLRKMKLDDKEFEI